MADLAGKKLLISVALLFVSSIFIFLTIFTNYKSAGIQKYISLLISIGFWLSIILGYIFLFFAQKSVKKDKTKQKIGLLCIFTNKYATVSDVILFASLMTLIVLSITSFSNSTVYIGLISIIFFAFNLHCIFNGRVFNKLINC